MLELTAQDLRDVVEKGISSTIDIHRMSRVSKDEMEHAPTEGSPTDEEIDDFIFSNPFFDDEIIEQLIDPGLLGFFANTARASQEWLDKFDKNIAAWVRDQKWLTAQLPWINRKTFPHPDDTKLWIPSVDMQPGWISNAPSCLLIAADILRKGKLLSEMRWREFEELIGSLLENEGWTVQLTKPSKDGGIDVLATKMDETIGVVRSVWQAKKYSGKNKVKLNQVRELSAIREEEKATKAFMVTTSSLTRDAIAWVKRDLYRLGYKEHDHMKKWIEGVILGEIEDKTE